MAASCLAVLCMKDKTHSLPSFSAYLNKGFALRQHAAAMGDARHNPKISPSSVFLSLFHSFVFRLPSFQSLERDLKDSHLVDWIGAERAFSDDTLRYSLCGFEMAPLEKMLVDVNQRLKRSKAFDDGRVQGRVGVAIDGIEVVSSFSRHCEFCSERKVKRKENGRAVEHVQYFHRAVGCQIVRCDVKSFLGMEWQMPGEGEVAAALRLLDRLEQQYGSRFFDIILLDALYAQSPVLDRIQQSGKDVVITLKQNCPDLYKSAVRLFSRREPDAIVTEQRGHKIYECKIWSTEGLPFADRTDLVRVVRAEEVLRRNRQRDGVTTEYATDHEWLWITTLDEKQFSPATIRRLGHDRWLQENNGWMDLTKHWAFKHGFLHACNHRPNTINSDGNSVPVPNRGLQAVALIALIAFSLCSAFVNRHSKLVKLYKFSAVAVARQLAAWIHQPPPIQHQDDS
jgi:Transposase DDE domain